MLTILQDITALVNAYEQWLADPDLDALRACGCGQPFRHRHGSYPRWTLLPDGTARLLRVLRLKCPHCGKTEAVLPDFLRSRYQYPWPTQQALVEAYVSTDASYRQVAAYQPGLPFQRLWQWVQAVAVGAVELSRHLVTEITHRMPGSPLLAEALADGRREPVPHRKARSVAKAEALSWVRPLLRQARRLWQAGHELGAGWGPPDPWQLLRFVEGFRQVAGHLAYPT